MSAPLSKDLRQKYGVRLVFTNIEGSHIKILAASTLGWVKYAHDAGFCYILIK